MTIEEAKRQAHNIVELYDAFFEALGVVSLTGSGEVIADLYRALRDLEDAITKHSNQMPAPKTNWLAQLKNLPSSTEGEQRATALFDKAKK